MSNDPWLAFGPITALVMRRKRALARYEEAKGFRWHGERDRSEARLLGIRIARDFFIPAGE